MSIDARAILARHGISAKKSLGQNFLISADVLDQIASAAELGPESTVLEIGPGLGVLTRELARRAGRVVAVEIDQRMVGILREALAGMTNVEVIQADILRVDPAEIMAGPYLVVANLPYYITSLVLRRLLEATRPPLRLVLMVQLEVAERIVARPGKLSLLAVSVQVYGAPRIVGRVGREHFFPVPDVDSAILRVDVWPEPLLASGDRERFFEVVSAGFSQSRKQIHNALGRRLWFPPGGAIKALHEAGIDPERRAQTLTVEEWLRLTKAIAEVNA